MRPLCFPVWSQGLTVVGLVQPFLGVCSSLQVLFPKAHSSAEALLRLYLQPPAGERGGRKNPGGRGVSDETGLGENVTDVALTAESLYSLLPNVLSQ